MRRTLTAITATPALSLVPAVPALAHVEHTQGDLTIAVGFATEPADLAVEIGFAGQTTSVAAEPDFEVGEWGTPGDYRAPFIPTQPGTYTFHVTGSVDGTDVDFSVTSGPKTTRADEAVAAAHDAADTARLVAITAAILAVVAIGLAIEARRGPKGQNAT
ncbi:MAG: hypothetical protein ABJB55_07540 [Actinomycetota bacterium]